MFKERILVDEIIQVVFFFSRVFSIFIYAEKKLDNIREKEIKKIIIISMY